MVGCLMANDKRHFILVLELGDHVPGEDDQRSPCSINGMEGIHRRRRVGMHQHLVVAIQVGPHLDAHFRGDRRDSRRNRRDIGYLPVGYLPGFGAGGPAFIGNFEIPASGQGNCRRDSRYPC